jgi:hypothetical protein
LLTRRRGIRPVEDVPRCPNVKYFILSVVPINGHIGKGGRINSPVFVEGGKK